MNSKPDAISYCTPSDRDQIHKRTICLHVLGNKTH